MLSSEIFPFSFPEFLDYKGIGLAGLILHQSVLVTHGFARLLLRLGDPLSQLGSQP